MTKKTEILEGFRTLVAGISRMGKSYYVKKVFIPLLVKFKPVIIFDRKEEYAGKFARDHDPAWVGSNGIFEFFRILNEKSKLNRPVLKRQVYVINCQRDLDYIYGLNFFLRLKKPVTLILDEAHDIFLDKDFYEAKKSLIKIVRYGASEGIDVVLISQRTKDIPPDIRSQFLGAVSFKQNHPDDIRALDQKGWMNADQVLELEKTQYKIFGDFPAHVNLNEPISS